MTRGTVLHRWLSAIAVVSLLVAACGSPSGSATTTTTGSAESTTVADQTTVETVEPSLTSRPTNPPIPPRTTSTTSRSTTTSKAGASDSTSAESTPTTRPPTTTTKPTTTTTTEPTTTTTAPASKTVPGSVVSFGYDPNPITVSVGDTIRWTNNSAIPHTVTSSGNWDSGNLASGANFSKVFDTPGTFDYFCTIHGAGVMSATVVVSP